METLLFSPAKYNGMFATINLVSERGYQVTLWQCGQAIRYTVHDSLIMALFEVIFAGAGWASESMQKLFEEDVIAGANL